jgi:hypothetical protein
MLLPAQIAIAGRKNESVIHVFSTWLNMQSDQISSWQSRLNTLATTPNSFSKMIAIYFRLGRHRFVLLSEINLLRKSDFLISCWLP